MSSTSNIGTFQLSPAHADAIQRLASHPELAAASRIPDVSLEGVRDFIAQQLERQREGSDWVFVVSDRDEVLGLCGLYGLSEPDQKTSEVDFWIGRPYWGSGHGTFAVRMVLEFAFGNQRLDRVRARTPAREASLTTACRRVLEKSGFQLVPSGASGRPDTRLDDGQAHYEITRQQWQDWRDGPALALLHPALKVILDAERAAGNEVAETGRGWPDPDSIFVRLRQAFLTHPSPLPEGVVYTEPNDPHWLKADYSSRSPRHVLAC